MVGGEEQAHLPRWPPQRWWMVTLKIVSLSLLMFPSSTGGKWQFDFEPETRPLPAALTPEGELFWGGGGEREGSLDCRPRATRYCAARYVYVACLAQRVLCLGECVACRGVCGV